MLKAVTLWEPYASLVAIGAKTNETRSRRTGLRGEVAIHAAKHDAGGVPEDIVGFVAAAYRARDVEFKMHFGCIVAVVEVVSCEPAEAFSKFGERLPSVETLRRFGLSGGTALSASEWAFGDYSPGRWIYRMRNVRRLVTPIPARGSQSFPWTVPPEVEALVRRQL